MAAAMGDTGTIVAADVRGRRLDLLARSVAESGAQRVRVVQANARAAPPFGDIFDAVLVDAPCSGLGTIRRDPDIRWRRHEADLAPLAASQREMLAQAATVVRPGGRVIYSTCSSEPEENEDVAGAFLRLSPDFTAVDARATHPLLSAQLVDNRGHLRTSPDRHGLEAFFGAVFERRRS